MEKLIEIYREVFPHTTMADWFYALLGLLLHATVKLKNVSLKHFKWRTFVGEFLPVWYFSLIAIFILVGGLPEVMSNYNVLDSALIGYSSSSIIKQLFKSKTENLNIL
ncbi:MAG: hypothetical protein Q8L81_05755 [Bacteroidota bacterium]|nr:hypothetical protein [Bacteroidota bacterium]